VDTIPFEKKNQQLLKEAEEALKVTLTSLVESQKLAVLATSMAGHPYTTLVAYQLSDDLRRMFFVTAKDTRKSRNIKADARVSLLIDSRHGGPNVYFEAVAATALGCGIALVGDERHKELHNFLQRHPDLREFTASANCEIIQVNIERWTVVQRFQGVLEWVVDDATPLP
jgi:hypothetical protein